MPAWMHSRAEHIMGKNPSMPESEAYAIATQQSHATGHSPKGFGTVEGKREAKAKYDTPKDDTQTADPGGKGKTAGFSPVTITAMRDEFQKIANLPTPGSASGGLNVKPQKYSQPVSAQTPSPLTGHQPMSAAPPVRS